MKKFLLITYAFPPMGLVGAIRPYKLCRYLPNKGWVPEVITVHPRKGLHLDFTLLESIPETVIVHRTKTFDPVLIYREYRNGTKRKEENETKLNAINNRNDSKYKKSYIINKIEPIKNILLNALSTPDHQVFWNIFILLTGSRILRREKDIQFIMTSSPPHSSQIGGMILSILFRKPYIVDYRDPWNDIFVIKKSRIRKRIEESLESWIIKKTKYVISTSETYASMLKKRFNVYNESNKYVYITNSYEKEFFNSIKTVSSPIFTMSYLGIFYPQYNPYYFFKALSIYLKRYNIGKGNIILKIIGNIDISTRQVLEKFNLLEITDVTGRVNHEEAIRMAKSSDLLLLLMGTTELTPKGWIPSKLIEYVACGKPILGVLPEGEAAEIIRKTRTGYAITSEDDEAIIKIIKKEYNRKKEGKMNIQDTESGEVEKFENDYTILKFNELFNSLSR
jgi:hypothetical protein